MQLNNNQIRYIALLIFSLTLLNIYVIRSNKNFSHKRINHASDDQNGTKISEDFWPTRTFENWYPFPVKESVIDHQDELSYYLKWQKIIEEGINNRYNIVAVLNSKRDSQDYLNILEIYKQKQNEIISELRILDTPERLRLFHDKVIEAAIAEINFYEEWARQKSDDPNIKFETLVDNSELKRANELLWAAYYEFQRLFPARDKATNDSIEMRLCQFDVI